ncbi:MAG: RNA-directed DNA polymerase [Polaromonas sp.]|nr:MAG: RNA-directed DNA polymerase [Polaromonas sp.]
MPRGLYEVTQCALYKINSKARLAGLLHVSVPVMLGMASSRKYQEFTLKEKVCPFGGKSRKARMVQTPTEALRPLHDRIHDLLRRCAPPNYAHAAVKGRSYRTNAEAHKGSCVAATFDLESFYSSTSETTVFRFFVDQMKCAPDIASLLARLICVERDDSYPCLPTGSPLSPLISVYANKPMFDKFAHLAETHALSFTCYVDDLTFSGLAMPKGLERMVTSVAKRYGHTLATHKTMTFGPSSAKHITGVVIFNGKITVPNARFRKARKIQAAINAENDPIKKISLMQKLSGLLGEAAYLDNRYSNLAKKAQHSMSEFRLNSPAITMSAIPVTQEDASKAGFVLTNDVPF